jgi:hypothetical protein
MGATWPLMAGIAGPAELAGPKRMSVTIDGKRVPLTPEAVHTAVQKASDPQPDRERTHR